jgi:lysophospholipase L1-like esterase
MLWYEPEVRALERRNLSHANGGHPPVFYGSSSFTLWDTLAEDFDPAVLNMGFGGSTLEACDYFFPRLVTPVHPRSLVVYAGDNDLGDGRSVDQVVCFFRALAGNVTALSPTMPFGFISVKPSPARAGILDRIRRFNDIVRAEMAARPSGYFVDVYAAMLDSGGKPRRELFGADGLHLNRDGYRLWGLILQQYRDRILIQ